MDENINLTILNEINKGAKMGMDSITYVSLDNKNYVEGQEEYQGIVNVLENIEFTRIQGTLVFFK